MVIFEWNKHQEEEAKALSEELGCVRFQLFQFLNFIVQFTNKWRLLLVFEQLKEKLWDMIQKKLIIWIFISTQSKIQAKAGIENENI